MFQERHSPVVIGGVGGSGTRVFAELLQALGGSIGEFLNPALDNLYFSLLFRREEEWNVAFPSDNAIYRAIDVFGKIQLGSELNSSDVDYLQCLLVSRQKYEARKARWKELVEHVIAGGHRKHAPLDLWGWKEPNSHVFLRQLNRSFPNMKYIHVIRDGFDMAYSQNNRQFLAWHRYFGLEMSKAHPTRSDLLDYWIQANYRALEIGNGELSNRFLVIHYEELFSTPRMLIQKVSDFLDRTITEEVAEGFCGGLLASSVGRHKNHSIECFTEAQRESTVYLNNI